MFSRTPEKRPRLTQFLSRVPGIHGPDTCSRLGDVWMALTSPNKTKRARLSRRQPGFRIRVDDFARGSGLLQENRVFDSRQVFIPLLTRQSMSVTQVECASVALELCSYTKFEIDNRRRGIFNDRSGA